MKRRTIVQTSLAAGLMAGMVARRARQGTAALGPAKDAPWRPIAWPFPRDAWPAGRAWRRGTLEVYVRPKLGFCGNCDTGVVTDEEVDRVTDVDLLDERFEPAKEGLAVRIGRLVRPRAALPLQADRRRDAPCRRHCRFEKVRSRHCGDRRQSFRRARTHRGLSASLERRSMDARTGGASSSNGRLSAHDRERAHAEALLKTSLHARSRGHRVLARVVAADLAVHGKGSRLVTRPPISTSRKSDWWRRPRHRSPCRRSSGWPHRSRLPARPPAPQPPGPPWRAQASQS